MSPSSGFLRAFAPDLWIAEGPPVYAIGPIKMPARAVIVRLGDGRLWVNSPVEASPGELEAVAGLGEVAYFVAPTKLHLWRLKTWCSAFPNAELWGPPGVRSTTPPLAGVLGDDVPAAWRPDLDQLVFRGNVLLEEVEFFHRPSRTLMMTDFIQNYPADPRRPLRNAVLRAAGVLGPGVPRDIQLSFLRRRAARASLSKLLAWDFDRLVVAHGDCLDGGAHPYVDAAFRRLGSKSGAP